LVEVLLSVAVIACGSIVVLPAFFKSADLALRMCDAYRADWVSDNLAAQLEEKFRVERALDTTLFHGKTMMDGYDYTYQVAAAPRVKGDRVVELQINLNRDGDKHSRLPQTTYVLR